MTAIEQDAYGHTTTDRSGSDIPEGPTARLYAAEDAAFSASPQVPLLDGTQEAAQAFATKVVRSSHWRRQHVATWAGQAPARMFVVLTEGSGLTTGQTVVRGVTVPELRLGTLPTDGGPAHASNLWAILHGLAHVMARSARPAHGREFANAYLGLVRRFLGAEAGQALLAAYRAHGVRYLARRD